jgi:hypothetical protein
MSDMEMLAPADIKPYQAKKSGVSHSVIARSAAHRRAGRGRWSSERSHFSDHLHRGPEWQPLHQEYLGEHAGSAGG